MRFQHFLFFSLCLLLPFLGFADIKPLNITGYDYPELKPSYSTNITGTKNKPYAIEAEFFPLGFSKDSKFAYLIIPPDEAAGFLTVDMFVQNLVNDKILYHKTYDFDKYENIPKDYPNDFASFIKKYKKEVYAITKKHHIVIQASPFITGTKSLLLCSNKKFAPTDDMGDFLQHLSIKMTNTKKQSKVIFNKKVAPYTFESAIAGYFISPFEDRIALLLLSMARGWEGPPHISHFTVVGTSLSKGFK